MTTTKITATDFDNWTEEKEQAEIERLKSEFEVKTIIVEHRFVGKFSSGEIVELPLKIKLEALEKAQMSAGHEEVETIKMILQDLGDEKNYKALLAQDAGEIFGFVAKYFETWQKVNSLDAGK